jgi:outer membrane protein assembly factor BamE
LQHPGWSSIIAPSFAAISSMILRQFQKILIAGCVIVASSGCVYRLDIPQGNRIDATLLQQLEIGMSRSQVEFLLGTPAVIDLYQPDKWHYIYYLKTGDDGEIENKRMTLTFTNELLSEIDGTLNPG